MATARFLAMQKPNAPRLSSVKGDCTLPELERLFGRRSRSRLRRRREGRTFNLELVESAVRMIHHGAKLIATNLDPNCPTENGIRPVAAPWWPLLETATGVKAFSVGKPSPIMMRAARKELSLSTDETIMIGDTWKPTSSAASSSGSTRFCPQRRHPARRFAALCVSSEIVVESLAEYVEMLSKNSGLPPWLTKPSNGTIRSSAMNGAGRCGCEGIGMSLTACGLAFARRHANAKPQAAIELGLQHADFLRIRENASRVDDRRDLAERLEFPRLAGCQIRQKAGGDIDFQFVAGANLIAQTIDRFERNEVAAVDRIAEEDARVEFGDHALDAGGVERDRACSREEPQPKFLPPMMIW